MVEELILNYTEDELKTKTREELAVICLQLAQLYGIALEDLVPKHVSKDYLVDIILESLEEKGGQN